MQQQQPLTPLSGNRPHKMQNCPVAVTGARTQVQRTPDGMMLTITAAAPEAQNEIVMRTERSIAYGAHQPGQRAHNAHGGGPEVIGYCPLVLAGNVVTFGRVPDGVQIQMKARDPRDVPQLQARVEQRARALRLEVPTS